MELGLELRLELGLGLGWACHACQHLIALLGHGAQLLEIFEGIVAQCAYVLWKGVGLLKHVNGKKLIQHFGQMGQSL